MTRTDPRSGGRLGTVPRMDTTTPPATAPVFLPQLPAPCCYTGRDLTAYWVAAWSARNIEATKEGEDAWTDHTVMHHGIVGVPTGECVECLEWEAIHGLMPGVDIDPTLSPAHYEAAGHFVRHAVLDVVRAAYMSDPAATLRKGDHSSTS